MDSEFISNGENEAGQDVAGFDSEITPEEFAEHMANLTARNLNDTKLFETVETAHGLGQVHVLGRVKREHERQFLDKVVHPILQVMETRCNGFIGKQFLLKDGMVKYAWVISYSSSELREVTYEICRSFEQSIPRLEMTEGPLVGPGTPQGKVGAGPGQAGSKGAAPVR